MSRGECVHLLVVEDDPQLADVVRRGLERDGHHVEMCANGDDAVLQISIRTFDAVVLDVMLPGRDGPAVCREVRRDGITTPTLLLTARDGVDDVGAGLEAGGDDYLTKPFAFPELRARLHSIMCRAAGAASSELRSGDLVLDVGTQEVRRGGELAALTSREFLALEYLMYNQGKVLSRGMLEEHVWGYDYDGISNTIDVHIRRLRAKLDRDGESSIIETVRGSGYRLRKHTE